MKRALALVAACALAGCASSDVVAVTGDGAALLEADRAFSRQLLEAGAAEAFGAYFDEKGIQFSTSGDPNVGKAQVGARVPVGVLSREPRHAEADGELGWTWGDWQLHERGAGGRRLAQGRYLNVWRRQDDGSWKVRADFAGAER